MSTVAELKKRFEKSGGVLTPEQHAASLRQKQRDLEEASKIAKARAARYNMTLRSMELENASKVTKERASDVKVKAETMKIAQHPGRRVSLLKASSQSKVVASHETVAVALNHRRDPEVAKQAVETAAKMVEAELENSENQADPKVEEVVEVEAAAAEEETPKASTPTPEDDGASFEMKGLSDALEKGDDQAINKVIVTEFLTEHDPDKVKEVDRMLEESKGKEAELMHNLVEKYDDPVAVELAIQTQVILKVEEEASTPAVSVPAETPPPKKVVQEEEEEVDAVEAQRLESLRIKKEEEDKIQAMDEEEKSRYLEKLAAEARHQEDKDRMLKAQLNVYSSGGAGGVNILAKGKGRGRGKRPISTGPGSSTEYIVTGKSEGGDWEVNAPVE